MRKMASKRLQLQRAADEAAQAAITPAAVGTAPPRPPPTVKPQRTGVPIQPVYTAILTGRRLWPSRKPPVKTESPSSGGYHVLQDSEPELERNSAGSAQAPRTDVCTDDPPITPKLHLKMAPNVTLAGPHLLSDDRLRQQDSKQRGIAPKI
uniref:Uncharacterized protein n=2 Tax=Peronospora matthiolae TaxID=2874970 RepID=A0AAV1U6S7_9STRA